MIFEKILPFPWQPYAKCDVIIELAVVDLPNPGTTFKALRRRLGGVYREIF